MTFILISLIAISCFLLGIIATVIILWRFMYEAASAVVDSISIMEFEEEKSE